MRGVCERYAPRGQCPGGGRFFADSYRLQFAGSSPAATDQSSFFAVFLFALRHERKRGGRRHTPGAPSTGRYKYVGYRGAGARPSPMRHLESGTAFSTRAAVRAVRFRLAAPREGNAVRRARDGATTGNPRPPLPPARKGAGCYLSSLFGSPRPRDAGRSGRSRDGLPRQCEHTR